MERILLITMVWAVSMMVTIAAPVSEQTAMLAAQKFIHQLLPSMSRGRSIELTRASTSIADDEDDAGVYVFNALDAYVVVSANDNLPDILAYGMGTSYDAKTAPAAMKAMLEAYHHIAKSKTITRNDVPTHPDVEPFIVTKWDQEEPYNNQCPATLGKGVCPTGCVATAMAQVMYYYRYPREYEWDKMRTTYNSTDSGEAVDAVAKLMSDCGTACFMNYSVDGSGTSDIYACEALRYDFGYAETTEYVERECYSTLSWDNLIYGEISAKRPVMYGAFAASSGRGVSGHEFILDGYEVKNGAGYYHVNWGWSGQSDDYFLLSVLNPDYQYTGGNAGSSGYSFTQSAIIRIAPAKIPMENTTRAYVQDLSISNNKGIYTRSSTSEDFPAFDISFYLYNVVKPEIARDYDVAVALYKDRELIKIFNQISLKDISDKSLDFMKGRRLTCDSIIIGKDIDDGIYQIRILSRETGTTEWAWAIESICRYVELAIQGTTMNTTTYGKEVEADVCDFTINKVEWSKSPHIGRAMMITINLTDKNKTSNSPIFLWGNASISKGEDDYQLLTGGGTNLDPGETGEIILEYIPQRSGPFTFILSGSRVDCNTPLYTFNVDVAGESLANVEIAVEITAEGSEIQPDDTHQVEGNVLKGMVKLTNNSITTYDDYIAISLYENDDSNRFTLKKVLKSVYTIDKDKTIEVPFNFDNLAIDYYYALVVYAYERGESKALNLVDGKISNSSIFHMIENGSSIGNITIEDANADVYNLHGLKIGKYSDLKKLPKGIYIVNHRKIFNEPRK